MEAESILELIPFSKTFVRGTFSGEVTHKEGDRADEVAESAKKFVENYLNYYRAMGDLEIGLPKEILVSTDGEYLLIRLFPATEEWGAVRMDSQGNVGFARLMLIRTIEG
ncbi:hypothetical protein [Thermovibrio ammonificans]|jgi:hypothetical protein